MDKKWKKVAKENYESLKEINPDKATKDQYLLYAASVAMLDHFECKDETINSTLEPTAQGENEGMSAILLDYMSEELADSSKYIELWHKTGNENFKSVARDELSHFEILAKYARTVEPNIDLQDYMVHYKSLMARLV